MKQGERIKYFAVDQHEDVLEIVIYGDITSWEWLDSDVSSYTLSKLITETDAAHIRIRINSYGGEVAEGLAIYNALKNHKAEITTVCDGFACSAASVVFMAGDTRLMNPASLLMIHNAWSSASGNAKELRKKAGDLELISQTMSSIYKAAINITEEELESARGYLVSDLKIAMDSPGRLDDYYMGQILLGQTGTMKDLAEKIAHVTKQEAADAAKTLRLDTIYALKGVTA